MSAEVKMPPQVESKTQILLALIDAATELRIAGTPEALDAESRIRSIWQHIKDADLNLPEVV